ncbi:MAG: PAAR domain-containing protein [Xanthomonadaceae bacterium]|jgi:uncharacterized Zn-binding protein involved in type VI secretion|nr:PAAR domain-containing protein [Xanthomonadaceae bacterium]
MAKMWIVLGDPTSSGGTVISANAYLDIDGKPVARIGDQATCPLHKGVFPIVTGNMTMIIDERPIACHGDTLACGCSVLSANQSRVFVNSGSAVHAASRNSIAHGLQRNSSEIDQKATATSKKNTPLPAENRMHTSGPGKWVTQYIDFHGIRNTGILVINRFISMGDEGRAFGSDSKDLQHTKRTLTQAWHPLDEDEQHLAARSTVRRYGEERQIIQTYLEGLDSWQVSGKSWHWQPVTADTVYEYKNMTKYKDTAK